LSEDPGAVSPRAPGATRPPVDSAHLRAEIERTRQDLGETVAALAEKADVKARAKGKVSRIRHRANEKRADIVGRARESSPERARSASGRVRATAQENPAPTAAAAAFVGGLLIGRLIKRG
jgi:ElaB/YqjD/DUF883 family membrane-anchored ribosome-binding protein